ncbi:MAG: L-aspartate oxidase [Gemmatimonadota bacterium]
MRTLETDILVVGSGIAGLTFTLKASGYADVLLLTKKERVESNTNYAQGGVAAAVGEDDDPALHRRDTLLAGGGLCHTRTVDDLVREGPARVRELVEWGVEFSRGEDGLSLGREGGHSRRRILHAGDLTGREIEQSLLDAAAERPTVRLLEDHFVSDLRAEPDPRTGAPRCAGALALDVVEEEWLDIRARAVLLATGGCGRIYRHTTNPPIAAGDGVALAREVGAAVANLEFVQFHPTALYPAGSQAFLISEALRGEGAVLRALDGRPFMEDAHPAGSLAPRDVTARAIDAEMKRSGEPHVLLDASPVPDGILERRFSNILETCRSRDVDPPGDPIPVVPAAHYQCGGVYTDGDGRTTVRGLFAAGEVACTGVHGANRLASNSLLEAVVFAHRAARRLEREIAGIAPPIGGAPAGPPRGRDGRPPGEVEEAIRGLMWEKVGIVRSDDRLEAAERELVRLARHPLRGDGTATGLMQAREVEFMATVAELIVRSAGRRRESRGLHCTESHPHTDSEAFLRDTVLAR